MKFSQRSQASFQRQRELENQLERANLHITLCSERIEKETGHVERLAEGATKNPQSHDAMYLTEHAKVLESEKADRRVYQKLASRLRAQIAALKNPSASALASRRKQQEHLAGIALKRSKLDRRIGQAVDALRALLSQRERLTTELHNGAYRLDLSIPSEHWDVSLTRLPEQLPDGDLCAGHSEEWANRFVGRGQKKLGGALAGEAGGGGAPGAGGGGATKAVEHLGKAAAQAAQKVDVLDEALKRLAAQASNANVQRAMDLLTGQDIPGRIGASVLAIWPGFRQGGAVAEPGHRSLH